MTRLFQLRRRIEGLVKGPMLKREDSIKTKTKIETILLRPPSSPLRAVVKVQYIINNVHLFKIQIEFVKHNWIIKIECFQIS